MVLGVLVIVVVGVLVVNYFRDRGQQQGELLPPVTDQKMPVSEPTTHTVVKGETLWSIAEKYYNSGYNWVDIANENKLANANVLSEGQKLTIPAVAVRKPVATSITDSRGVISGATYRVEKGEYLWEIAVRAYGDGYKWVDIAKENNLANPDLIHAGNILILPR